MAYVDGFVIAVPKAKRQDFIAHAEAMDPMFLELGATRVFECWQDDVPPGKQTDFFRAVECKEDEAVVFSWVEWPDKATRDKGMAAMEAMMETDPRFDMARNPPPFDGKRMIYGGFASVVSLGE